MGLVPFATYLESQDLKFGLSAEHLERLRRATEAGSTIEAQLDAPASTGPALLPAHLLRLRRAVWRYQALEKEAAGATGRLLQRDRIGPQAARWAMRSVPEAPDAAASLEGALVALAAATLARGRLRFRLCPGEEKQEHRTALGELAEHSEGCAGLPAHRWLKAARAVRDGLLWIEVVPPEEEGARVAAPVPPGLRPDLQRAAAKAVLDELAARAERAAIAAAADSLLGMLSRPPRTEPLAGVAVGRRRLAVVASGGPADGEAAEFELSDGAGLVAWLRRRELRLVALARLSSAEAGPLFSSLVREGFEVEPVHGAGLARQARDSGGRMLRAAAETAARRLRDPLSGTEEVPTDALGLGEYLDQIDSARLRAALDDARGAAHWLRRNGRTPAGTAWAPAGIRAPLGVRSLSDLRPGMELGGVVCNLVGFGAFVEVGLEAQGLVHLSELSEKFVQHPSEVVAVGDRVRARVLEVDADSGRLALSLRAERKTPRRAKRGTRAQSLQALENLFGKPK